MTKQRKYGTLGTRKSSDKKKRVYPQKEANVLARVTGLLGQNKIRYHSHAHERMGQRDILIYEVLQALNNGKYIPKKDRFSTKHQSWEYCIEGKTNDSRLLRIGLSFEQDPKTQARLLVITVIDLEE